MRARSIGLFTARLAIMSLAVVLFASNTALAEGLPEGEGGFVSDLVDAVVALWLQGGLKWIVGHVLVNVVVAVAATLYTGEFVLARTAEFLYRKLLPYTAVYAVAWFIGDAVPSAAWLPAAALGAIEIGLIGDLLDNAAKLGLKLPQAIANLVLKPDA